MIRRIKENLNEFKILIKNVPAYIPVILVVSLFSMNLLANKSIAVQSDWLALDCGIIISWAVFLSMDILTRHFGPKAATQISVFSAAVNLFFCIVMYVGSVIPGNWGEAYAASDMNEVNTALDATFGGTWYVLAGSTAAFIVSAFVNNFTNWGAGKLFFKNPDSTAAYFARSYISTAIGQFTDNLVFAFLVSRVFFGWSVRQCIFCAVTGMGAELLFEVVFSFFGLSVCRRWREERVGEEYFRYINEKRRHGI